MNKSNALHLVSQFLVDGCAFIPENVEGEGDRSFVLLKNGQRHGIDETAPWFLNRLVCFFGYDLTKLREIYARVTGRKYLLPLPLTSELTLLPLKVRVPIGNQAASGWFVAEHIRDMRSLNHIKTELRLNGGHEVTVLWSRESCEAMYRNAALAKAAWRKLHQVKPEQRLDNLSHLYKMSDHTEALLYL